MSQPPKESAISGGSIRASAPGPRRSRSTGAATLVWAIASFVLLQAALVGALEMVPAVRDPEFGIRLQSVRRQIAEKPDRPLVLVIGSSRAAMGVRPGVLAESGISVDRAPIVFNHSLVGSGPIMELMCLDRLLAQGIRPDLVFVEFWPAFYKQDGPKGEENRIDVNRLDHRDLRLVSRYSTRPASLCRDWIQSQLLPVWSHRFTLLSHYAPAWLPWGAREDVKWIGLDGFGWLPPQQTVTKAKYEEYLATAREYFPPLLNPASLSARSDRAMRELVARCRRERIQVALLYMPEGSAFRSWYSAEFQEQVEAYLRRLHRELGVPTIDARRWIGDDDFIDGFHLLPRGARAFTQRFGREVIRPLLEGKSSASLLAGK